MNSILIFLWQNMLTVRLFQKKSGTKVTNADTTHVTTFCSSIKLTIIQTKTYIYGFEIRYFVQDLESNATQKRPFPRRYLDNRFQSR